MPKFYNNWHNYPYHHHFHWLIVFLIALISCSSLLVVWKTDSDLYFNLKQGMVMGEEYGTGFEARRQAFLDSDGGGYKAESAIWAWLEIDDGTKDELIHQKIMQWGMDSNQCTCDDDSVSYSLPSCNEWWSCDEFGDPAWTSGFYVSSLQLLRVLLQYEDVIDGDDAGFIENKIRYLSVPQAFASEDYSLNNQFMLKVFEYLREESLGYSGGNSEDWLNNIFNELTTSRQGSSELDSEYTKTLVMALYTLYDFTEDDDMKNKAKMLLDFLLLDSILDVSAELHGGHIGRTYNVETGGPRIYHWIYWGIGPDPGGKRQGSFYDAYVSTYRLPALIYDIGTLHDEPSDYWHLNKENNAAGHNPSLGGRGKWNYITPYYNLGGSEMAWMLNIEGGFRLWIDNDQGIAGGGGHGEFYFSLGKGGHQNLQALNAIFIRDAGYLHILDVNSGNIYHQGTEDNDSKPPGMSIEGGKWRFLRSGNVAVAVNLSSYASALEVGIIGVDYASYSAFKNATRDMNGDSFTTGKGITINKGDTIKARKRLEAIINPDVSEGNYEDGSKSYIVYWNDAGRIATVQHHDLACEYNFSEWETDEDDGCMSEEYEEYEPYDPPPVCDNDGICETGENSNNCPVDCDADDVLPDVVSFTVEDKDINESPVTSDDGSANIAWNITDEGGSHLQKVEVWTAPDANGSPGEWKKTHTKIITGNTDLDEGSFAHFIAKGTYWYGLHVYDKDGNHRTAENYSKGPIQLIQTKESLSLTACNNNGTCDEGENAENCIADCPTTLPVCDNDGICETGESSENCSGDCPSQAAVCDYDGICEAGESETDCPSDCSAVLPACDNDGICEAGEDSNNCANDCSVPYTPPSCNNNGFCGPGENLNTCPNDCSPVLPTCDNDGICEPGENTVNCVNDCPAIVFQQSIMSDFNCDKKVNIQDFAILLTRWGKTDNLDNYNHSQCDNFKSLNIVREKNNEQETINLADFGRLLSCWGTPQAGSCYE